MSYKIYYISPYGEELRLSDTSHDGAFLTEAGITQLVGEADDISSTNWINPGQRFTGISIKPMTGSLSLFLDPKEGDNLDSLQERIRGYFSRTKHGTLVVFDEDGFGAHIAMVRLSTSIAPPRYNTDPTKPGQASMDINLICDEGVWQRERRSSKREVEITNDGDTLIFPVIKWRGNGGEVTLPSGVTFTLPSTSDYRYLHLDNSKSLKVTDEDGNIDRPLWNQIASVAVAEGIPVGETRTYRIPEGAEIIWNLLLLDPWR